MANNYESPLKLPRIKAIATNELHERGKADHELEMHLSKRARVWSKANKSAMVTDQDHAQPQPRQVVPPLRQPPRQMALPMMQEEFNEFPFTKYAEKRQREEEKIEKCQKWTKQPSRMSKQARPQQSSRVLTKSTNLPYSADTVKDHGMGARMGANGPTGGDGIRAYNSPGEIMSMLLFTSVFIVLLLGCIFCSTYPYNPHLKGHSQSFLAEGMRDCLKVCEMAAFVNGCLEAPSAHTNADQASGIRTSIVGTPTSKLGTRSVYCQNSSDVSIKRRDLPKGASLLGLLPLSNQLCDNDSVIGLVNLSTTEQQQWKHFTAGWATCYLLPFDRWKNQCLGLYSKKTNGAAFHAVSNSFIHSTNYPGSPKINAMIVKASLCAGDLESFHVFLAAIRVVSETQGDIKSIPILVISNCCPVGALFSRDELKEQEDDLWLFYINLARLRSNLAKPVDVGACNLVL